MIGKLLFFVFFAMLAVQPTFAERTILVTDHMLSDSELQQLNSLNATIVRNFTLAFWYEIDIPSVNIAELEKLDFVKEVRYAKEFKPLPNGTKATSDQTDYSILAAVAIALILILTFYVLRKRKILAFIFLFLFLSAVTFAGESGKIDPAIFSMDSEVVNIIVEIEGDEYINQQYLQAFEMKKFRIGNFYSMKISKSEVNKLGKMHSVKKAWLEAEYKPLLDVAVPLINTTNFLNNGYNGSGVKVCVLDTGINKTHPALPRVVAEKDFVTTDSDGDNPIDYSGHGTHVAGIVASTNSTYRGIAFASDILNAKVFSSTTDGAPVGAIMDGIDWCITNGAHIMTLSLGGLDSNNDGSDALSQYVDFAVDQGKVVTISAGNSGAGGNADCRTSGDGSNYSICSPGLAHKVITVGSTQSGKSGTQDTISTFSSRGPTKDERIKPDVTAPGQPINSTWINGGFNSISGTSMSAPMVAGLAALMLQARNITPEELKALIMNTAVELGASGKDNSYGAGRVNGSRLFNEINNTARATIRNESRIHNIFVPANTEIRATLYWPENYSAHNNIDLQLLDPAGNVVALSASVNNTDEIVNATSAVAGNWKLLVNPVNVSSQLYAIAANYKPSEQMYLVIQNVSNNVVYHRINVTNNSKLTINLDWNSTDVNMDLYLYNTTGWLVNYSNGTQNYENVSINNPQTGIWLVRATANSSSQYALSSTFSALQQILDNVSPNVTIIEPANKTYATQNISLSFSVAENLNAVVNCTMILDNVSTSLGYFQNNSLVTRTFSAGEGAHSVYTSCADTANNTGTSVINFTVDVVAPNITFVPPTDTNNSFVRRNYTFINVSIIDNNTDACALEWNGTNHPMTRSGSNCHINKTDSDGTYTYNIFINDSAGNVNTTARAITFDTTLPSASINFSGGYDNTFSPNNDNIYDEITFNVTASETVNFGTTYILAASGSRVKTFNRVDDTKSILKTWNGCFIQSCATGIAPDGTYKIEIEMTDRAGNVNATNLTEIIILDTTPMQVYFSEPTPNNATVNTSNSVTINVTTGENAAAAVLEWNGANETMSGNATSWLITKDNIAGNYTFRVYVNDSLGNWNVTETRFVFVNAPRNISQLLNTVNQSLANISMLIVNSTGHVINTDSLLPFVNYTLRFNASGVFIETADFLPVNLNVSAVPNITKNITAESSVSAAFNESGGILDSYVWVDLNNLLPAGNFTAKIVFPRVYALYFYLNGTRDAIKITRANACDANLSNTPCYNISANASTLYLPSFSGGAGGNDIKAPALSMGSPTSATYSSSSIALSYTAGDNVAVDKCWYRLNSDSNTTLSNCANTTIPASEGSNTLTLYANDTSNNINQTSVTFTFTPAATPSQSSSGGGVGSSAVTSSDSSATNKNQTKPEEEPTDKTPIPVKPSVNQTQEKSRDDINKTQPVAGVTGLVTASSVTFVAEILILVIIAVFVLWKLFARKKFTYKHRKSKQR